MIVIGLTGPTGAGKTTALEALAGLGFEIVDCDRLYYQLLARDGALRNALEAAFGPVFLPDGNLDRRRLAARVFGDPEELARLNALVYPAMSAAVEQKIRNCSQKRLAIDAVNLVESGMGELCSATVAVTAPPAVRLRRIMVRDGLSEEQARARIAAQKADAWYREHCTLLLENEAEDTERFARLAGEFFQVLILLFNGGEGKMDMKEWKEKLMPERKNGYDRLPAGEREAVNAYCQDYKAYLDAGKTERECVQEGIRLAEAKGFRAYQRGMSLQAGDKVYVNNRGKMLMLAVIGLSLIHI